MKNIWVLLCRLVGQFMRPSARIGLGVLVIFQQYSLVQLRVARTS